MTATASSEDKRARVKALGADVVVDYDSVDGSFDIVLESVGGEAFRKSLAMLKPLGRLVIYGVATKDARPIDPIKLLFKSHAVMGFHLDAMANFSGLTRLARLLADDELAQVLADVEARCADHGVDEVGFYGDVFPALPAHSHRRDSTAFPKSNPRR